jgi:RNA polymerase sigma factor (sigma-70 family)
MSSKIGPLNAGSKVSADLIGKPYVNSEPELFNRKLNREQRLLFDEHRHLTRRAARKFIGLYPRLSASFEEIEQNALIGLWRACSRFDSSIGAFLPFALQRINWHLKAAFFGRFAGNSAVVNARRYEMQGSAPVIEDGEYTLLDQAEARAAEDELSSAPGKYRLHARLYDIRLALRSAPGFDKREKRVLYLRFVVGLEVEPLAERIGFSVPVVKRALRSGVRKLRTHFANQGALPISAPIPNDGNRSGCPAEVR